MKIGDFMSKTSVCSVQITQSKHKISFRNMQI